MLKTIWASVYLLQKQGWSKREAQVVLGRWAMGLHPSVRRAAMGSLSSCAGAVLNAGDYDLGLPASTPTDRFDSGVPMHQSKVEPQLLVRD